LVGAVSAPEGNPIRTPELFSSRAKIWFASERSPDDFLECRHTLQPERVAGFLFFSLSVGQRFFAILTN
jgi:hypothetical protein